LVAGKIGAAPRRGGKKKAWEDDDGVNESFNRGIAKEMCGYEFFP